MCLTHPTGTAGSLLNQNAIIIRSKNFSQETQFFLYNSLKKPEYINHIEKIFRGNANQANITVKELLEFTVAIPPLAEQKAIASVLSYMDKEIAALEKRRAKTEWIKKGMMQELLTGRKRLIVNDI
ncbi:MAG: restriction endonuclease subunit S [Limnospira sp. PMC 1291.21]|uniref:Type I restriction-modification enzyme S subunit n=3 Tax=Limnospira TaxID=2596745 RepID=A0A9P1NYP9_9CYAN|nr:MULTISPECIES: restriction endonuclease subunit S [Limnospira]EKD06598.1 type I restriction-modification enzyme S subunit [Arthrospira platensis C1]MDY7054025.1 restriction endonuclease subunit S [Limnospira fusiformis LS22]QJB26516.1 restriction endonuclease subunit S [Limnospira fusiformis SAG 85.79]RAQ47263.1 restriction endonuclease subunit S [Arthrospira sp. O9.13F]EDZ94194.1 type I restriction-modification enzyme S subunit [Limnospira maxima CS-328]